MSYANRLAALGDVYVQEHDRSMPDWPDYTAEILVRDRALDSNWRPAVHLDGCTPDEIRAFAAALVRVADRLESTYAPSEVEHEHVLRDGLTWRACQHLDGTPGVPQVKSGFVECMSCDKLVARGCAYCGTAVPVGRR